MISTIRLSRARVQSAVREALDAAGFPTARLINPRVVDPDDPCVWLEVAHHAYDFDAVVSIVGRLDPEAGVGFGPPDPSV